MGQVPTPIRLPWIMLKIERSLEKQASFYTINGILEVKNLSMIHLLS